MGREQLSVAWQRGSPPPGVRVLLGKAKGVLICVCLRSAWGAPICGRRAERGFRLCLHQSVTKENSILMRVCQNYLAS